MTKFFDKTLKELNPWEWVGFVFIFCGFIAIAFLFITGLFGLIETNTLEPEHNSKQERLIYQPAITCLPIIDGFCIEYDKIKDCGGRICVSESSVLYCLKGKPEHWPCFEIKKLPEVRP